MQTGNGYSTGCSKKKNLGKNGQQDIKNNSNKMFISTGSSNCLITGVMTWKLSRIRARNVDLQQSEIQKYQPI